MKFISKNISFEEATASNKALKLNIDNTPDNHYIIQNMRYTAALLFEPIRTWASAIRRKDTPIRVTSFYRSKETNKAVGGARRSDHLYGYAIDIDIDGMYDDLTNADLFNYIRKHLNFHQLIWEYGDDENPAWIHVSIRRDRPNNREVFRKTKNGKMAI